MASSSSRSSGSGDKLRSAHRNGTQRNNPQRHDPQATSGEDGAGAGVGAGAEAGGKEEDELISHEFLKCPVCEMDFNNPKVLPCLHSFCAECLKASLKQSNIGEYGAKRQAFIHPCCYQDQYNLEIMEIEMKERRVG
jgi:hypothetical protein